jgi:hypothetical protein
MMPKSIDRRPCAIGARYTRNLNGALYILDKVEYDIETDSDRAFFHNELSGINVELSKSDFLDNYTLATLADVPLASEPELKWWEQISELAKKIEQIAGDNSDGEEITEDTTVKIGTLAAVIIEQCEKIAAFNA